MTRNSEILGYTKLYMTVVWLFVSLSLLFFLASFSFQNQFVSAHSYYVSELVCSGPAKESLCTDEQQPDIRLFRGLPGEPTQVKEYQARYVSAPFAWLLAQSHSPLDTLREVALKTYVIKSVLAAALVTFVIVIAAYRRELRPIVLSLFLVMFSIPYAVFAMSGFYHASIASLAVLTLLVTTRLWFGYSHKRLTALTLFTILFALFYLVSSTRFEALAALIVFVLILPLTSSWRRTLSSITWRMYLALLGSLTTATSLAVFTNDVLKRWMVGALTGTAQVLSRETADQSIIVGAIGDAGLSVLALITLIDNSTRNIGAQFADEARQLTSTTVGPIISVALDVILRILAWVPILLVAFAQWRSIRRALRQRASFQERFMMLLPLLIWICLFHFVPMFARTSWFIWYVMPLLLCAVATVDHRELISTSERVAIVIAGSVNVFSMIISNQLLGPLNIGGITLSPLRFGLVLMILVSLISGLTLLLFRGAEKFSFAASNRISA